jgi:hypothetical protein
VTVLPNKANPVATSQSAGAALACSNPDANVDADPEGYDNIDVGADVDVADGEDDGDCDPFCDAAVAGDDDGESLDDDDGPLRPFRPGTFSYSDATVETICLYGEVRNNLKRNIISQGGRFSRGR